MREVAFVFEVPEDERPHDVGVSDWNRRAVRVDVASRDLVALLHVAANARLDNTA